MRHKSFPASVEGIYSLQRGLVLTIIVKIRYNRGRKKIYKLKTGRKIFFLVQNNRKATVYLPPVYNNPKDSAF